MIKIIYIIKLIFILLTLVIAVDVHSNQVKNILLLGFQKNNYTSIIAETIANKPNNSKYTIRQQDNGSGELPSDSVDLIITLGKNNSDQIAGTRVPVLNIASGTPAGLSDYGQQTSTRATLHMAQPLCRHLQLIALINDQWDSVGIVAAQAIPGATLFKPCIDNLNMTVNIAVVSNKISTLKTLNKTLSNNDILLALPDPDIYNSRSIKNILLTAYRQRVPVIGYSDSFVKAGALAAVYTRPRDVGKQAIDIVDDFFNNNGRFDKVEYSPKYFNVSINRQVGRSLNLNISSESEIESRLKEMSKR